MHDSMQPSSLTGCRTHSGDVSLCSNDVERLVSEHFQSQEYPASCQTEDGQEYTIVAVRGAFLLYDTFK